jgi:hypothetical protein
VLDPGAQLKHSERAHFERAASQTMRDRPTDSALFAAMAAPSLDNGS